MPSRLAIAFLSSLSLHIGVLASIDFLSSRDREPPPRLTPAMLEARLLPTPRAESVLKDTLSEDVRARAPAPLAADPRGRKRATAAAQRRVAEHVFYPAEAIAQGIEGEVTLLLTLSPDGTIAEASLARSSGHGLLDRAALRAAHAVGRLPGLDRREVILPVVFRLSP